jgi:hypothetical protein
MNKLLTALILSATAITAQAKDDGKWAQSVAKEIHPAVTVQKINSEVECREISRQLKGTKVYYRGPYNGYGGNPTFDGTLNSKDQYVMLKCSQRSGSYAFVAPKSVIDQLVIEQKQREAQQAKSQKDRVKDSGLL